MRPLHRWIGFATAVFLALIAGTGAVLQAQTLWSDYHRSPQQQVAPATLPPANIENFLGAALTATRGLAQNESVVYLALRMQDGRPVGEMEVAVGLHERRLSFDARTGEPIVEPVPKPVGRQEFNLRSFMLQLHRGDIVGVSGNWVSLGCGLSLFALRVTGLIVYTRMFLRRAKSGQRHVFW
jgi:uncharacterized iron-regulated membrane protein